MGEVKKYQLTCPKCHYEFHYDNGYYDAKIAQLGVELREIMTQLEQHKLLPKAEQYARTDWWKKTKKAASIKQQQITELKAFRKMANQQVNRDINSFFKQVVKEEYGEETYIKLIRKAEKELEAYTTADIMRTPYSRANYKSDVISINKL